MADPAAAHADPQTIVVGLGNPVVGDDGVGWCVADEVERLLAVVGEDEPVPAVRVERLAIGGLGLMEAISGFRVAILVDAAQFPGRPIGEVRTAPFDELDPSLTGHIDSAHDMSLHAALDLGRRLGAALPERIDAVTIQIGATDEFSETLSPAVQAAVPVAAAAVMELLRRRS